MSPEERSLQEVCASFLGARPDGLLTNTSQQELQTLQIVRATFESMRQLVEAVHEDVSTLTKNYTEITSMWFFLNLLVIDLY